MAKLAADEAIGGGATAVLPEGHTVSAAAAALLALAGAAAFLAAQLDVRLGPLVVIFLYCAARLGRVKTAAEAFVFGAAMAALAYLPHAAMSGGLSVAAAPKLAALIVAVGVFTWGSHAAGRTLPGWLTPLALAVVWTGLEWVVCNFRPVYFPWATPGLALPANGLDQLAGDRGVGFVLMLAAAAAAGWRGINQWIGVAVAVGAALAIAYWPAGAVPTHQGPAVVVLAVNQPPVRVMTPLLDQALAAHPEADVFLVGPYVLSVTPNDGILAWARSHKKFVITANSNPEEESGSLHHLYVVTGQDGATELVVEKDVPPENAGEGAEDKTPAESVWDSPWGKIGFATFHELADVRTVRQLEAADVQGLIVPLEDTEKWAGPGQGRGGVELARERAVEMHLPVARVFAGPKEIAGGGEIVGADGTVLAREAPMALKAPPPGSAPAATGRGRPPAKPVDISYQHVDTMSAVMPLGPGGQADVSGWVGIICAVAAAVVLLVVGSLLGMRGTGNKAGGQPGATDASAV